MSVGVDANVLVYAANGGAPEHSRARAFLEDMLASGELVYFPWPVLFAFMRIMTRPGVAARPLSYAVARDQVEALLDLDNVRLAGEEDGFWGIFTETADPVRPTGNLFTDAHIAALLRQHGVRTFYTNDVDFRRFAFLRVINPLVQ